MKTPTLILLSCLMLSSFAKAQAVDLQQVYQQTAQAEVQAQALAKERAEAAAALAAQQRGEQAAAAALAERYWGALKTVGITPNDVTQSQNKGCDGNSIEGGAVYQKCAYFVSDKKGRVCEVDLLDYRGEAGDGPSPVPPFMPTNEINSANCVQP